MKKIVLFLNLLIVLNVSAQIEYSNWPMTNNRVVNFPQNGTPFISANISINPNNPNAWRSSSAISDRQGRVKLFSNPDAIFNSDGNLISNTSFTSDSGSIFQSQSLILPQPGSRNYYVIHSDHDSPNQPSQLFYSVINQDVDFSSQELEYNVNAFEVPISEGHNNALFTAYFDSNINAYYLVSFGADFPWNFNNSIFVHKLDCEGLSFVNQYSFSFPGVHSFDSGKAGDIKFNSDGSNFYLVVNPVGANTTDRIYQFDFNSGVVSNLQPLPSTDQNLVQAIEVSSSGDFLYYFSDCP